MNSAASVSSLTIQLVSGYGLGILRISSDQEPMNGGSYNTISEN